MSHEPVTIPPATEQPVDAVEVRNGDKLMGYAIFFSGGWDGYVFEYRAHEAFRYRHLQRVVCGAMKHEAVMAVLAGESVHRPAAERLKA